MIHRHLDIEPGTPPGELPAAAVADILERGDLDDWRPIAAAIAEEPHGEVADRVMSIVDAHPMYGVSPLWRAWIERCRARVETAVVPRRQASLAELRRRQGLTQVELAARRRISQSDLSKLERRGDVRVSTLRAHVRALGGRLRIVHEADRDEIEILLAGESGEDSTR